MEVVEENNDELKKNTEEFVKRKRKRVQRAKKGEVNEEGEVSRCRFSRRSSVHRTRQVAMWRRVRLPAANLTKTLSIFILIHDLHVYRYCLLLKCGAP